MLMFKGNVLIDSDETKYLSIVALDHATGYVENGAVCARADEMMRLELQAKPNAFLDLRLGVPGAEFPAPCVVAEQLLQRHIRMHDFRWKVQ
jgi:hypothetical protein